jgi:hypothetical protein
MHSYAYRSPFHFAASCSRLSKLLQPATKQNVRHFGKRYHAWDILSGIEVLSAQSSILDPHPAPVNI